MKLDNMKLCTLCLSSEEWPYTETKAIIHDRDGMHSTLGKTWSPAMGHPDYDQHLRCRELGLISAV